MPHSGSQLLTQAQAINEALSVAMAKDESVIVIGEGVPDPKGIFGTTLGLSEQFNDRVFDMPVAENGMTGVCIGAALSGMRPVMVHQRIEFALLAMDQLINNAAKWNYMFDGQNSVPLVVRLIIGRGWGQGPQHSQSLQSLFAHIPGLKVVMPVTAADTKGMLISAIEDDNPVIFIEHRWLHPVSGQVPQGHYLTPLDKAQIVRQGQQVTIAAFSYMVLEALQAANVLAIHGLDVEVIDMRSVRPLDTDTVMESLTKTGHLVVADTGHMTNSIAAELIAKTMETGFHLFQAAPTRIASPDFPVPTSHYAARDYYPGALEIVRAVLNMLCIDDHNINENIENSLSRNTATDVPNPEFIGPF